MNIKIQFLVNENEYNKIVEKSRNLGYSTVNEYCKTKILKENNMENNFITKYSEMINWISNLSDDTIFVQRDFEKNLSSNFGKLLIKQINSGILEGVNVVGKDRTGTVKYKKTNKFKYNGKK